MILRYERLLFSQKQLANWLEHYAEALEINVWTSSTVVSATQDASTFKWHVVVKRENGVERTFDVKHLIFATGFGGTEGKIPSIPDMVGVAPPAERFAEQIWFIRIRSGGRHCTPPSTRQRKITKERR